MKSLVENFIRRPVLTSAISILILLLGLFGLIKMPLRFLPKMDQALIDISTVYPGANNQIVKSFVTSKIQNALVGLDGIDYITSSSTAGMSDIKIYLSSGISSDHMMTDIMQKISSIVGELPSEVKTPVVTKKNTDNQAILILGFSSKKLSRIDVADYLQRRVAPKIEAVDGVGRANVWGDQYVMQVWLNPSQLAAYHLSPQEVSNALRSQNVLASPGKTQGSFFNYTLNTTTALHTPEEFNNLVIKVVNNVPVYLKDIGEARLGSRENETSVYYNNQPTTMIGVVTLPTSNPLSVVGTILKILPDIAKSLPEDMTVNVVLNRTDFIRSSLREVIKSLFESMAIVLVVIFLFLGNFRAAIIPSVTIPLSLIGICFFMQLMGYSINTITLLAMVLGVGLVVDDAIVVIENGETHLTACLSPLESLICATQELVVPIIAMTITLAAVYVPIALTDGLIGQLFKEFAFTLAGSVILSGVLALTLAPMMGSRLMHVSQQTTGFAIAVEKVMTCCQVAYRYILIQIFQLKKWMLGIWVIISLLAVLLYAFIPSELTPTENQGFLIAMGNAPASANLSYLEHYADETQRVFQQFKEIHDTATVLSTREGYSAYLLARQDNNLLKVVKPLQQALAVVPGLDFHVIAPSILANSGPPIQFVLQANVDEKNLYRMAKLLEAKAMASGEFMFLFDDLNYSNPEASIVVDPARATAVNVSMSQVANALTLLMGNQQVQQFSANDQSYDVVIKTLPRYQLNPEDLQNISIPTNTGFSVPLSTVASIKYSIAPTALNQFQKMNSVTIMGAVLPGKTMSQGLSLLASLANDYFPKKVSVNYAGSSRQFMQEGHRMLIIFALAILVIFLILSMQFESYRDALIILLGSVPMALFAALLPLKYGLGTMNIYTQIGLLTLVGLISKHGILITRFANEIKKRDQVDNKTAVIEAAILRFRPILMTTAAILFGAIPLMHAAGAGSGSRHAIGVVIGYGISIGTVLTLLLLPVVYTVFSVDRSGHS